MADTLEALELKITHNSGGAAGALKEVTSALTSLLPVITDVNTKVHSLAIGLQNIGGIKALGQAVKSTTGSVKDLANSMKAVGTETKSVSATRFTTLNKTLKSIKAQIRDFDAEQRSRSGLPGGSYASIMADSVNPANGMTGAQLQALKEKLAGTATEAVKASTSVKKVAEETINVGNAVEKLNLGDKVAATNDQIASCIRKIVELNDKIKNAENDSERNKYMDQFATMEQRYISLQGKLAKAISTDPQMGGEPGAGGSEDISKPSVFQRLSKGFERMHGMIQRIMMRRVITAAIRAVAKAFKEGYTNLYNWSEAVGGQFSKDMDKAAAAMTQFKNSLAGAVAPALQALVPIIQTVCSWIATLMSYISMFVAAISGMTKYYTALTGDTENYSKAAGGAAKANKDLLASFDELNVIQSESGGGGGGGGGGANDPFAVGNLDDNIRSRLARIGKIVGAATMAIGGILLFTEHPFVGLAMLSAGFATTYGSIRVDWETTPNKIESVLNTIKSIVDVAFLAVGAVLTFTNTNIPLGVALMAKGLPGVASGILKNIDVAQEIKTVLAVIEVAVSAATLAVGAVMTFTGINIPLGIAMMAAGVVGLATTPENWDVLAQKLSEKLMAITAIVSGALLAVGAVLAFSSINIPLGIGMMAAGAVGLGKVIADNWDWISEKLKTVISVIEKILKAASLVVGAVLVFTGVHPLIGLGLMVYGLAGSPEAKEDPNSLVGKIQGVIETIKRILTIGSIVIGAILVFFGGPALMFKGIALLAAGITGVATNKDFKEDIVNTINGAIKSIGDFLNTWIVTPVKTVISKIVSFVANLGTSIKKTIDTVITSIGKWWDKWIAGPIGTVIDAITSFVSGIVTDVQDVVTPVIEAIGKWWSTYIAGPISAVFDTISNIISTLKAWLGIKETKHIDVEVNTKETGLGQANSRQPSPTISLPDPPGLGATTASSLTDKIASDLRGNNYLKENKLLKVSTRAEGGFIRTGQLFIAGENGIPEMIGSFGGNNAVANNDMIVTGIRQGVRDAMTEQNALLRQQNEYLSALLSKRIYAELKPSAALGATNARSAELYAKVTGG